MRRSLRSPLSFAALTALTLVGSTSAIAQSADSSRKFSLFGGTAGAENSGARGGGSWEVGGSGDFRLRPFPLGLRATLAFAQSPLYRSGTTLKFGTFSLDAVGRPTPKLFGAQLYLLGGLGVGTRAGYSGIGGGAYVDPSVPAIPYYQYNVARQTWTFVESGAGLEFGRFFVQGKAQIPVASDGYVRFPLSFGFRFLR